MRNHEYDEYMGVLNISEILHISDISDMLLSKKQYKPGIIQLYGENLKLFPKCLYGLVV